MSSSAATKANPYEKHSDSRLLLEQPDSTLRKQSSPSLKERWMLLKNMLFSGTLDKSSVGDEDHSRARAQGNSEKGKRQPPAGKKIMTEDTATEGLDEKQSRPT